MSKGEESKRTFYQITAISFNFDGSQVCVCAGTNELYIMKTKGSTNPNDWETIQILKEHIMEANAIDWNHEMNRIVSGSIDRSVFVWNFDSGKNKFIPEFVSMDEKLSILDINWAKNGKKFVAGTSSA